MLNKSHKLGGAVLGQPIKTCQLETSEIVFSISYLAFTYTSISSINTSTFEGANDSAAFSYNYCVCCVCVIIEVTKSHSRPRYRRKLRDDCVHDNSILPVDVSPVQHVERQFF